MSLRKSFIVASTAVTAWMGIAVVQRAIAMPLLDADGSTEPMLISQSGYEIEQAQIIDIDNEDSTIWIRTESGDYQILPVFDAELLARARPGSDIFLLKAGDALIDVALSETDLSMANYDAEAEAARLRVRALYEGMAAASSQERPVLSSPVVQQAEVQPVRETAPVRGLW